MSENKDSATYDVLLVKRPANVPGVMKVVMTFTGFGLKQSKDLIDNAPSIILKGVSHDVAADAVSRLKGLGAQAEIQQSEA